GARGSDPSNAKRLLILRGRSQTMFGLGGAEMLALLILGVLLFGKKLPEVGKSLGRSLVEVKKGLQGIEDEVAGTATRPAESAPPPGGRRSGSPPRPRSLSSRPRTSRTSDPP